MQRITLRLKSVPEYVPVLSSLKTQKKLPCYTGSLQAGAERIELPSAVLETDVLPLYDAPKAKNDAYGIRTRECRRERAVC